MGPTLTGVPRRRRRPRCSRGSRRPTARAAGPGSRRPSTTRSCRSPPPHDRRTEILWGAARLRGPVRPPADGDVAARDGRGPRDAAGRWPRPGSRPRSSRHGRPTSRHVDTRRPYRVDVGGGRHVTVVFYDGDLSGAVSFEPARDRRRRPLRARADRAAPGATAPRPDGDAADRCRHRDATASCTATTSRSATCSSSGSSPPTADAGPRLRRRRPRRPPSPSRTASPHPEIRIRERTSWSCHHGVLRWSPSARTSRTAAGRRRCARRWTGSPAASTRSPSSRAASCRASDDVVGGARRVRGRGHRGRRGRRVRGGLPGRAGRRRRTAAGCSSCSRPSAGASRCSPRTAGTGTTRRDRRPGRSCGRRRARRGSWTRLAGTALETRLVADLATLRSPAPRTSTAPRSTGTRSARSASRRPRADGACEDHRHGEPTRRVREHRRPSAAGYGRGRPRARHRARLRRADLHPDLLAARLPDRVGPPAARDAPAAGARARGGAARQPQHRARGLPAAGRRRLRRRAARGRAPASSTGRRSARGSDALAGIVAETLRRAAQLGFTPDEVAQATFTAATEHKRPGPLVRVLFAECTSADATFDAERIVEAFPDRIEAMGVLLEELPDRLERYHYDLVATTTFHADEAQAYVGGPVPVVAMLVGPGYMSLVHEVAGLPPGSKVGLVCGSQRGVENIAEVLQLAGATGVEIVSAVAHTEAEMDLVDRDADIVLLSREAMALGPRLAVRAARAPPRVELRVRSRRPRAPAPRDRARRRRPARPSRPDAGRRPRGRRVRAASSGCDTHRMRALPISRTARRRFGLEADADARGRRALAGAATRGLAPTSSRRAGSPPRSTHPPRRRAERPGGRAGRVRAAPRDLPPPGRQGRRARAGRPRWTALDRGGRGRRRRAGARRPAGRRRARSSPTSTTGRPRAGSRSCCWSGSRTRTRRPGRCATLVDDTPLPERAADGDDDGARGLPGAA